MKIALDAGHGGKDSGAVSTLGGVETYEKELTLRYVMVIKDLLEAQGHTVFLTRSGDYYIFPVARLKSALRWTCDAFVSIHCNASSNPQANGMEVLYRDEENDLELAECVYNSLLEALPEVRGRGIKDDEVDLRRQLAVLGNFPVPACLVEVGFITNEGDLHEIERVDAVSQGIANGIDLYAYRREPTA